MLEAYAEVLLNLGKLHRVFSQPQRLLACFRPEKMCRIFQIPSAHFSPAGKKRLQPLNSSQMSRQEKNPGVRPVIITILQKLVVTLPNDDCIGFHLKHFIQDTPGTISCKAMRRRIDNFNLLSRISRLQCLLQIGTESFCSCMRPTGTSRRSQTKNANRIRRLLDEDMHIPAVYDQWMSNIVVFMTCYRRP